MTFEEFKKMTYHTRESIRIPGSRTVLNKKELLNKKGHYDPEKGEKVLRRVYEDENYENK